MREGRAKHEDGVSIAASGQHHSGTITGKDHHFACVHRLTCIERSAAQSQPSRV